MERALEVFAVIHLTVMGLSHIVHHRAWAEFFIRLRGLGHAGVFVHGFLSLAFGSLIVAFHWVWVGIPALLTVVGVLYIVKTMQCFLFPAVSLRSLNRVSLERSHEFIYAGVGFLAVAAVSHLRAPIHVNASRGAPGANARRMERQARFETLLETAIRTGDSTQAVRPSRAAV